MGAAWALEISACLIFPQAPTSKGRRLDTQELYLSMQMRAKTSVACVSEARESRPATLITQRSFGTRHL
jgi:hypothetical protein